MLFDVQKSLQGFINVGDDCVEFIKHDDFNVYVYINGMLTDILLHRHLDLEILRGYVDEVSEEELHNIYTLLIFGKSRYNKNRISKLFAEYAPQYFV